MALPEGLEEYQEDGQTYYRLKGHNDVVMSGIECIMLFHNDGHEVQYEGDQIPFMVKGLLTSIFEYREHLISEADKKEYQKYLELHKKYGKRALCRCKQKSHRL